MKRLRLTAIAFLLAIAAVLATHVQAQQSNSTEQTFLTFSAPVEMPGVVLEPGTYEFRLADPDTSRNVVQVRRKGDNEVIGQWSYVQASRPQATGETVVMFRESKEGTTPAVQYWYYPGEKVGKEFIYPKDQAQRIAARTGQAVRSDDGPVTATASAETREADTTIARNSAPPEAAASIDRDDAADADAARRNAPAASQPTAAAGSTTGNRGVAAQAEARVDADLEREQPRQTAQAAPIPSPAPRPVGTSGSSSADAAQDSGQPARAELPKTASPLALSGLLGLLSLGGAFGLRFVRR